MPTRRSAKDTDERRGAAEIMGVLQDFERRLEGAVEGFFARAFRSGLQPVELAKAIQRYAADTQHVTADGVVVPNVYRIEVSTKDHERLETFGEALPRELAEVLVATAADRGWHLRGPVKVRVAPDDSVQYGRYQLAGRVEVVEDPSASSRGSAGAAASAGTAGAATGGRLDHTQVVDPSPKRQLQLRVRSGGEAGTTVPVERDRVTMGRHSECDVTLQDTTVSRKHAALVRRNDGWWAIDLGSTNGTSVNGTRAAEQRVRPGDRIELGDAVVELVEG
jgi:hypothetical protein